MATKEKTPKLPVGVKSLLNSFNDPHSGGHSVSATLDEDTDTLILEWKPRTWYGMRKWSAEHLATLWFVKGIKGPARIQYNDEKDNTIDKPTAEFVVTPAQKFEYEAWDSSGLLNKISQAITMHTGSSVGSQDVVAKMRELHKRIRDGSDSLFGLEPKKRAWHKEYRNLEAQAKAHQAEILVLSLNEAERMLSEQGQMDQSKTNRIDGLRREILAFQISPPRGDVGSDRAANKLLTRTKALTESTGRRAR